MEYFEWYSTNPAAPEKLTFGEAPYVLRNFSNLGNTLVIPQTTKSPFQVGETLLNVDVSARMVALTLRVVAPNQIELYRLKNELAKAMVVETTMGLEPPVLCTLRYYRDGMDPVQLQVIPRESPQFSEIEGAAGFDADLDLLSPCPYWERVEDSTISLVGEAGGFDFPIEFPFESTKASSVLEVINGGDVSTPVFARVYGSLTTFRLKNETTGETLEVTGAVNAGEYVEVDTSFGSKSLVYVNSAGVRTDIFSRLTLGSVFWQLKPGVNTVRFEANTLTTGSAVLWWRERFAGV